MKFPYVLLKFIQINKTLTCILKCKLGFLPYYPTSRFFPLPQYSPHDILGQVDMV